MKDLAMVFAFFSIYRIQYWVFNDKAIQGLPRVKDEINTSEAHALRY